VSLVRNERLPVAVTVTCQPVVGSNENVWLISPAAERNVSVPFVIAPVLSSRLYVWA
jgi:hypothetical protein